MAEPSSELLASGGPCRAYAVVRVADWHGRDLARADGTALRLLEHGGAFNLDEMLKAWERGYIEAALRLTRGNVSQAAKLLGVNRTTLYSRMNAEEDK